MPPLRTSLVTLTWLPVLFTFGQHVYQPYFISGASMTPAFNPGTETTTNDIALVKKFGLKSYDSFAAGDVVLFRSPEDPEKIMTKRIVGVPGDSIKCRSPPYPKVRTTIPRNHFWVEGDNSFHSVDSNSFGPISQALIVGKVMGILWPLSRFGSVKTGGRDAKIVGEEI